MGVIQIPEYVIPLGDHLNGLTKLGSDMFSDTNGIMWLTHGILGDSGGLAVKGLDY